MLYRGSYLKQFCICTGKMYTLFVALFNNIFPTAELNTLFKTKYYAYLFQGFTKNIFIAVNTSYLVMCNKVTSSVSEYP